MTKPLTDLCDLIPACPTYRLDKSFCREMAHG